MFDDNDSLSVEAVNPDKPNGRDTSFARTPAQQLRDKVRGTAPTEEPEFVDLPEGLVVGKPKHQAQFRVHPDIHVDVWLHKSHTDRKYLVARAMRSKVQSLQLYTVFLARDNDTGKRFLWPIRADSDDGYTASARQGAIAAMETLVCLVRNQDAGKWDVMPAPHPLPQPDFGVRVPADKEEAEEIFWELALQAFGADGIIDSLNHPVVVRQQYRNLEAGQ